MLLSLVVTEAKKQLGFTLIFSSMVSRNNLDFRNTLFIVHFMWSKNSKSFNNSEMFSMTLICFVYIEGCYAMTYISSEYQLLLLTDIRFFFVRHTKTSHTMYVHSLFCICISKSDSWKIRGHLHKFKFRFLLLIRALYTVNKSGPFVVATKKDTSSTSRFSHAKFSKYPQILCKHFCIKSDEGWGIPKT